MSSLELKVAADPWALSFGILQQAAPALELVHPDIGPVPDQYLLGEHLLVAPVLEPDCGARRVVLPAGRWADLFDPGRSFTGPAVISVPVGPDDIPVFVRAVVPEPGDRRRVDAGPSRAG